ncbi:MAG: transposase family protein [Wenzhouxiangella sp.]
MTVFKLIAKLLKFKGFRCTGLAFRRGNRLDVLVKPYKNGCRCPECGRRGTIVRQRSEPRYWRDIPVGPWSIWLMLAARDPL